MGKGFLAGEYLPWKRGEFTHFQEVNALALKGSMDYVLML
jgi:hypothetical protein